MEDRFGLLQQAFRQRKAETVVELKNCDLSSMDSLDMDVIGVVSALDLIPIRDE